MSIDRDNEILIQVFVVNDKKNVGYSKLGVKDSDACYIC